MTCSSCLKERVFLSEAGLCLPCVQIQKHRKDVEEFIKSAEVLVMRTNEPMQTEEIKITDF